jgi:hypothetical protein
VDVETLAPGGKLPLPWQAGARLECVGFAVGSHRFAFPAGDREAIGRWLGTSNPKVFHNCAYDLPWLLASGFDVCGTVHDTLWPLAFENGTAARGLKAQGNGDYPVYLPRDSALFPDNVRDYCANDASATLALYTKGSPWYDHPLYRLYSRLAPRIAHVCLRGLPVFPDRAEAIFQETAATRDGLHRDLMAIAPIKWTSQPQVAALLGIPRTDDASLLSCDHPCAPILRAFRRVNTLISTFLDKFRGVHGIHGLIKLGGSRIGRTSSDHMNLQNIPRQAMVRRVFGHSDCDWLKLDFAQAELVVAAVLSGCRPLLQAFRCGRDPHVETASRIFGVTVDAVTKDQRAIGKLLNFALLYGAGVGKVLEQAEVAGIMLTEAQAAAFRDQWFRAYPEIKAWQDDIRCRLERREAIQSAFGRRWMIDPAKPRSWNQALQAPVASTASDLLLLGLDAVWDRLKAVGSIIDIVHDEVDVLLPQGAWPDLVPEITDIARTMAAIDPTYPMRVEISRGPSWGELDDQDVVGAS